MDFKTQLGLDPESGDFSGDCASLIEYVNLKLMSIGQPVYGDLSESSFFTLSKSLLANYQEKSSLLSDYLPACDHRIQEFVDGYFSELSPDEVPKLPKNTLILDRHGVARTLSLPAKGDHFSSDIMDSYRIQQGVLHNPKNDRRTTKGVFHVAEGGLPIPHDKKAVPKLAAARLLAKAFNAPETLLELPFLANETEKARAWTSLLLRPVVVPEVEGFSPEKTMEIRFFAPGNMVCNLDFVESIFGNGGDPFLTENDGGLDPEHWTGHTGCVILAPHLMGTTKKELGLPHISEATDRQKRDGMCWESEDELYNDGGAFKITCRDASGRIITAISDNYFGYCKKEVKTQLSFAANLSGLVEEEHAGGALVFPGYDLGEMFELSQYYDETEHTYDEMVVKYAQFMEEQPEGYAIDSRFKDIHYLPEKAKIDLRKQNITWEANGETREITLLPHITYVYPSGYKVELLKPAEGRRWRLAGYLAESLVCHKPSTVSGGGKSEISKSISDAILSGPVFVQNFKDDFDMVDDILNRDYSDRYLSSEKKRHESRPLLSSKRTLGSVVKMLTPSEAEYTQEYNQWLETIPQHVKEIVLIVKRFYKKSWGSDWRHRFSVDLINGEPGNVLRYRNQHLVTQYLRVGYTPEGAWRTFCLRKDFLPSAKISLEDDISASIVIPSDQLNFEGSGWINDSVKLVHNCEYRFFQRPDDAIIRGYDKQAELDLSSPGSFLSNYQPKGRKEGLEEVEDVIRFEQYTQPMQDMITEFNSGNGPEFYATNAHPRIVDGAPSKNPRYLQVRPDLKEARAVYLSEMSSRLFRRQDAQSSVLRPVTCILPGRRNNPADPKDGVKPLCVNNPIHYMELPELFMEYIVSITGKSPSTTGAGSEGALTKSPFNALPPIYDLNNALVSYLLTEQPVYITASGYVGPNFRVDHDISLLIPEIWGHLQPEEIDPKTLIENGLLEKVEDFEYKGELILASRCGYRITSKFVRNYFARVFSNPDAVFTEEILKPELQDLETFVIGMKTILSAHKQVAQNYFEDGSVEEACPPLKALLHIMAHGDYQGHGLDSPEIREMFTRNAMMGSDWYKARLQSQQDHDIKLWEAHIHYLEDFMARKERHRVTNETVLESRLATAKEQLATVSSPEYIEKLKGTLGRQPV